MKLIDFYQDLKEQKKQDLLAQGNAYMIINEEEHSLQYYDRRTTVLTDWLFLEKESQSLHDTCTISTDAAMIHTKEDGFFPYYEAEVKTTKNRYRVTLDLYTFSGRISEPNCYFYQNNVCSHVSEKRMTEEQKKECNIILTDFLTVLMSMPLYRLRFVTGELAIGTQTKDAFLQ